MSLFKNRKRSGMVLTGVVLSSGVVSAVNQGVAGAVPQSEVANGALLGNFANKGAKGPDWKYIIMGILGFVIVWAAIKYFVSGKERQQQKKEPFSEVFCKEKAMDHAGVKAWKEIEKFKGCVYEVSRQELRRICSKRNVGRLEKILQACDKDKIKIEIRNVNCPGGCLKLVVLGEENKYLGDFCTKYATTNADKLNNLETYLVGNRVFGKTPFGKVFCSGFSNWDRKDVKEFSNFGEIYTDLWGKTFNVEIEDLRLIANNVEQLDKQITANNLGKKEIKVKIATAFKGTLALLVFGGENDNELIYTVITKSAVKDNEAIGKLLEYLKERTEKKENVKGNVNENNGIGMDIAGF